MMLTVVCFLCNVVDLLGGAFYWRCDRRCVPSICAQSERREGYGIVPEQRLIDGDLRLLLLLLTPIVCGGALHECNCRYIKEGPCMMWSFVYLLFVFSVFISLGFCYLSCIWELSSLFVMMLSPSVSLLVLLHDHVF